MNYKLYEDNFNKSVLMQSLPQIISDHESDYERYFMTVTFESRHLVAKRSDFVHFFSNFYRRLNQATINHVAKTFKYKAKVIAVPEKSISNKYSNIPHYHCVLMIHKNVHDKFVKKCIVGERQVDFQTVHEMEAKLFKSPDLNLQMFNVDLRKIYDENELSSYMTKSLLPYNKALVNYSIADLNTFYKGSQCLNQLDGNQLDNWNINYDDILLYSHGNNSSLKIN